MPGQKPPLGKMDSRPEKKIKREEKPVPEDAKVEAEAPEVFKRDEQDPSTLEKFTDLQINDKLK